MIKKILNQLAILSIISLYCGCNTQAVENKVKTADLKLSPLNAVQHVEAEEAAPLVENTSEKVIPKEGKHEELLAQILPGAAMDRDHTDWYGLYMQGEKVGWLAEYTELTTDEVKLGSIMYAKIRGMGRTTEMTIKSHQLFNRQTGAQEKMYFSQSSPDQMGMSQTGLCDDGKMRIWITTGDQTQEIAGSCKTTLIEALAMQKMVMTAPEIGKNVTITTYEPSMMQMVKVKSTISKIEPNLVDGVEGKAIYVQEETIEPPGTGVNSTSIFDQTGRMLSTEASGVFTAKLESEEEAKKPGTGRDILVANVVKIPSGIDVKKFRGDYQLGISGMPADISLPENLSGQKISRQGQVIVFSIQQQVAPQKTGNLPLDNVPEAVKPFLQNEPQYQSEAPEIQEVAKKLTVKSQNLWETHKNILGFVYGYLQKSYVPALANAVDVLKIGKGDCTEHSTLYVALARAAGIPARQAVGVAYWPQGGGFGWHAWAEIWTGSAWITVDPTWGQEVADPSHLLLARGAMGEQVRIAGMLGNMKIEFVK